MPAPHGRDVRIGIVTESFPPDVNGVAHSVLRIAEHLAARGHHPLVIAPRPASGVQPDTEPSGFPVIRLPSLPMPGYRGFRLGVPSATVHRWLLAHGTDLVHLASPFLLGFRGGTAARRLDVPALAVYQTDVPGYARAYHAGTLAEAVAWRWLRRIHNAADRTLAPLTASAQTLREHGVRGVWMWGRGVDCQRFDPARRSAALRRILAPGGEALVGYVGRLATEKRVGLLAPIASQAGARLVIVGSGPAEDRLRLQMPGALFLGQRQGDELAQIFASLDVFVHGGCHETFGQTIQEAAASGLPVVAPAAGGPLDLVEPGVTGYLVPPGDPLALAEAAGRLVADPALRARQGRAARQRVLARSWSTLGDALIGHYTELLTRRPVPPPTRTPPPPPPTRPPPSAPPRPAVSSTAG